MPKYRVTQKIVEIWTYEVEADDPNDAATYVLDQDYGNMTQVDFNEYGWDDIHGIEEV